VLIPAAPTTRAAVLVALCGLVALALPAVVAVALAVVVLAAAARDARLARAPVEVARSLPLLLSRGVVDTLTLRVAEADIATPIELGQAVPAGITLGRLERAAPGVWQADVVASRRGRHVLPPVRVRRTGPLGLGTWTSAVAGETIVTVYPDLPAARRLARAARSSATTALGQSLRGPLGLGTDFESVREYQPDDDVRLVNWKATARHDRPMSNTYRVEQSRRVLVAVDCGRLSAAPVGGVARLDATVDAAAAVALAADAAGDRVGLLAYDDGLRAAVRPVTGGGAAVLRALADLEPRSVDSDAELVLRGLPRGQRSTLLVFTDLLDEASARSLLALLPAVAVRHAVAVVSVVDTDLAAVLHRPPGDRREASLVAAVADLLEARLRARTLLRRAGAVVVEAPPERLAAACVAAYLSGAVRR